RTNDLFAAVVEIVAERSDLRLEFKDTEQTLPVDYEHIPILGCAKEPGQHYPRLSGMHGFRSQPAMPHDLTNDFDEAVHILAAHHGVATSALATRYGSAVPGM